MSTDESCAISQPDSECLTTGADQPVVREKSGLLRDEAARRQLPLCLATLYARLLPRAAALGYALALHGSLARDLDVVAIPWTDAAVSTEDLVAAMIEGSGGFLDGAIEKGPWFRGGCPGMKPHGRLVWVIHLGGGPYIDLSVLPRLAEGPAVSDA